MVSSLDHMVLTCADARATAEWYARVLGVEARQQDGRWALHFGQGRGAGKINLHQRGREVEPHALEPTPGSGDLCFVTEQEQGWWLEHLLREGVVITEGPVGREGARGAMESIYVRDPDGTLVEIARYGATPEA